MGLYQYDSTEDKLNLVAGSTNFSDAPVGAIFPFGGTDIPISFLLCDGSAVSRTDYEDLFAVIGTAFGTGDGSTTFNLPDLREAVPKGAGLTGYTVGAHLDADGLAVGEFLDDRVQAHTHSNKTGSTTAGSVAWTMYATNQLETATEQTNNGVIGRFGATTEVKAVGVNYIIKAKMVAVPADFMSAVDETIAEDMHYQTGTVNLPSGNAGDVDLSITFDTPMPDDEYVVTLNFGSQNLHAFTLMPGNLSTTGFAIAGKRTTNVASTLTIRWKAFRIPH